MRSTLTYKQMLWLWSRCGNIVKTLCTQSSTAKPVKPHKAKGQHHRVTEFLDYKRVLVKGGKGGDGCLAFLHLYKKEFAGPGGGNGGNGGHVIFTGSMNRKSLNHLQTVIHADDGERGRGKTPHGKSAEHTFVEVPPGTLVRDEAGEVLSSIDGTGDYYIAARGGAGGRGNHAFVSSENTLPTIAENGALGEERYLHLELRIMAHAGLIGFPNAGKSTLLRAISRARPKVAAYPFTTLRPYVGMVEYDDHEQIAVADIPGLIEGAHENRGLGIAFLKHVQRCLCLLYVIDLSVDEPWTQLETLKFELEQYQQGLSERPHAILGNKIDLPNAYKNYKELEKRVDIPVYAISAKHGEFVDSFLVHLRTIYDRELNKQKTQWEVHEE